MKKKAWSCVLLPVHWLNTLTQGLGPALLLTARPLQALAESFVLALLLAGIQTPLAGYVQPFVFNSGIFFLCGVSGFWAVLRTRLPNGTAMQQAAWETAMGLALSVILALGLPPLAAACQWDVIWKLAPYGPAMVNRLLALTGVGYLICRVGVRLWLIWNRMRRERMVWQLTHSLLQVVILFAVAGSIAFYYFSPYSNFTEELMQNTDPVSSVFTSFFIRIFPTFTMIVAFAVVGVTLVFGPAVLFSYLAARQTTRRLEELAAATGALRNGDLRARVKVTGEDELAHLQANFNEMANQLGQSLVELKAERDQVEQLLGARREMVAVVSHELRTPVAVIRAGLDAALNKQPPLPPGRQADMEVLQAEMIRLQGLIDDLFSLSRLDAGGLSLSCTKIDLTSVLRETVEAQRALAWQAGRVEVALLSEGAPGGCMVVADAARLKQVAANLLRNAVRHTPAGGLVAVQVQKEEPWVRFEVIDTGEGIQAGDLPHIWERFYRGENEVSRDSGAGLGLALVKELVEAMGGQVGVESQPGAGSRFWVRLHT